MVGWLGGVRSRRRQARLRTIEALRGDWAHVGDGLKVRIDLRADGAVELGFEIPLPADRCAAPLLRLGLAREGLIGPAWRWASGPDRGRLWTLRLGAPARAELTEIVARVRRAQTALDGLADPNRAFVRGLVDADPEVRLAAATGAGVLGRAALAQLAADRRLEPGFRRRAVRSLAREGPESELSTVLIRVALDPRPEGRLAVRALARLGEGSALPSLLSRRPSAGRAGLIVQVLLQKTPPHRWLEAVPFALPAGRWRIFSAVEARAGPSMLPALDRLAEHGALGVVDRLRLEQARQAVVRRAAEARGSLSLVRGEPAGALGWADRGS